MSVHPISSSMLLAAAIEGAQSDQAKPFNYVVAWTDVEAAQPSIKLKGFDNPDSVASYFAGQDNVRYIAHARGHGEDRIFIGL
ncbi:MAG: hypothetical protein KDA32_00105 [Phycisphaerales bacterium]|nr:hypothetical protein [Phycisphaerales bacterium]